MISPEELAGPRPCCSFGCHRTRLEGKIWCELHDTCSLCDKRAVEGRGMGRPRCEDHSELGQLEKP